MSFLDKHRRVLLNIYLPAMLFLTAFLWKLYYIDSRDICHDEPFTIFYAQYDFWDMLKLPANNGPNPPLFMALLHFWIKLFGIEAHSVRMLPLIFNALTVVYIYLIGKKFYGPMEALLASGLFILSTYHFYFGLETRAYSLLSLATAASLYHFQSLTARPSSARHLLTLILWNFVLVYSHYFGWFVVFMQLVAGLLYVKNRLLLRRVLTAICATGILFIPMAVIFVKQFLKSSQGTWVQPPSRSEFLSQLHWFLNSRGVFGLVAMVVALGSVCAVVKNRRAILDRKLLTLALWWLVPYSIMFLVSFKVPMFINRYILFNTIGLYLFIAVLVGRLYGQRVAVALGVLILGGSFLKLQINSKEFYYREVKNYVLEAKRHKTDSTKVLLYPYWSDLGFMYYYDRGIFENYANFDSLLEANGFVRYWSAVHFRQDRERLGNGRVIYTHNTDLADTEIYRYLDSTMVKTDSVFYPQCFVVAVFEPRTGEPDTPKAPANHSRLGKNTDGTKEGATW